MLYCSEQSALLQSVHKLVHCVKVLLGGALGPVMHYKGLSK